MENLRSTFVCRKEDSLYLETIDFTRFKLDHYLKASSIVLDSVFQMVPKLMYITILAGLGSVSSFTCSKNGRAPRN